MYNVSLVLEQRDSANFSMASSDSGWIKKTNCQSEHKNRFRVFEFQDKLAIDHRNLRLIDRPQEWFCFEKDVCRILQDHEKITQISYPFFMQK